MVFLLQYWSDCDSFRDWVGDDLFEEWGDGDGEDGGGVAGWYVDLKC